MVSLSSIGVVWLAALSVAIADSLIKKNAAGQSFEAALTSPWMLAVLVLYVAQIAFFAYVFSTGVQLGIAGNLQVVLYSLTIVLAGVFFFSETLSLTQYAGIGLGVLGAMLMVSG